MGMHSLFVDGSDLEVHGVRRCEDVGGTLHHRLARLGHGDRRAPRDEDRLVARAQRQDAREAALDQHHLQQTVQWELRLETFPNILKAKNGPAPTKGATLLVGIIRPPQ